jgi:hypothetical protein
MGNRKLLYALTIAGMSLATAWAIRGQFGHEQGAAWAGGIGGLSIVLLAKRPDWNVKAVQAALAAAVGWGAGGMISYGIVVGYGKGLEFGNVYYGLAMLFVIGALFGLLGGGLFGLTLASNIRNPVDWPRLITEMAAGGLIVYFFLVVQLGYLMTPPRSEAWAVCLGMAVAMLWYMLRHHHEAPLKVALWAGLGAGFGFAFGNFLQVMGNALEIPFNFWNVMEYSIGFFGGIGMAYGTFTSAWEPSEVEANKSRVLVPLLLLTVFIPFIVWEQSFGGTKLSRSLESIGYEGDGGALISSLQWMAVLLIAIAAAYLFRRLYSQKPNSLISVSHQDVFSLFVITSGVYTLYSIIITLAFMSTYRIEQYLYVVNYAVIYLYIGKIEPRWEDRGLQMRKWSVLMVMILVALAVMTFVAINSHGEMPGAHRRFE